MKQVKNILTQLLTKFLPHLNEGKGPQIDEVCNSLLKNWKPGLSNQRVGSEEVQAPTRTEPQQCERTGHQRAHKYYEQDREFCHAAPRATLPSLSSSSLQNLFAYETD